MFEAQPTPATQEKVVNAPQVEKRITKEAQKIAQKIVEAEFRITPHILTMIDGMERSEKTFQESRHKDVVEAFVQQEHRPTAIAEKRKTHRGILQADGIDVSREELLLQALQIVYQDSGKVFPHELATAYTTVLATHAAHAISAGNHSLDSAVADAIRTSQERHIQTDREIGEHFRDEVIEKVIDVEAQNIVAKLPASGEVDDQSINNCFTMLIDKGVYIDITKLHQRVEQLRPPQ